MQTPTVLVVASTALARGGIERLARAAGLTVVGQCSASEVVEGRAPQGADVLLADADGDGLDTIALLCREPEYLVVALGDDEPAAGLLSAGATASISPGADPAVLAAAVTAASLGLVVFHGRVRDAVLGLDRRAIGVDLPVESLTSREREVLQLLAEGLTNPQVAIRLRLSDHTVKFHVTSILGKLGARTRSEAVARAARLGWIRL